LNAELSSFDDLPVEAAGQGEAVVELPGAAVVAGEQHDSLVGGGDAACPPEVQRTAGVFVEDGQVVVGVTGHPDDG
jgi:hypothetical protein